jgi:hypothetical protein
MGGARRLDFADEADQWGRRHWDGVEAKLSPEELAAVDRYVGGGYFSHNDELRGVVPSGTYVDPTQMPKDLDVLDAALRAQPVPEDVLVHRGVAEDAFGSPLDQLKGTVQQGEGYMSTWVGTPTSGPSGGRHPVQLNIRVPQGTPAIYIPSVAGRRGEQELLLGRGLRLYIHDVRRVGQRWVVDAEIIP